MTPIIKTEWIYRIAHDLVEPCNLGGTSYDRLYRMISNIRSELNDEDKER